MSSASCSTAVADRPGVSSPRHAGMECSTAVCRCDIRVWQVHVAVQVPYELYDASEACGRLLACMSAQPHGHARHLGQGSLVVT
jgi:hypothetical protein